MNVTPLVKSNVEERLAAALDRLTEQVRRQTPGIQSRIHHGSNDHFAWWVVARLSNPTDESKVVDVSIECRSTESGPEIRADLAREDGTVLRELPTMQIIPATAAGNGALVEDMLRGVEGFLLGLTEAAVAELR